MAFAGALAGMLVFRRLSLWLLQGQSVGPFPREFQVIATGFVPDVFPAAWGQMLAGLFNERTINVLALLTAVLAALGIVGLGIRTRIRNRAFGADEEPRAFCVTRNLIVAAALIFTTYKLAGFRGLPNVFLTMGILTVIYAFVT